jgi:hypothetical protein
MKYLKVEDLRPEDAGRKVDVILGECHITDGKLQYKNGEYCICQNKAPDTCGKTENIKKEKNTTFSVYKTKLNGYTQLFILDPEKEFFEVIANYVKINKYDYPDISVEWLGEAEKI